ncbi:MAG: hypothetical protein ACRDOV_02375 [Streptomyces sp.]
MTQAAKVTWNGRIVTAAEESAAGRGVGKAAEHLLGVSRQLVPLEEGTLERSGAASADGLAAAVSYDTVYAVRQHEELTWRHDPGRQAKYLESPADTERPVMLALIAAELRRALR